VSNAVFASTRDWLTAASDGDRLVLWAFNACDYHIVDRYDDLDRGEEGYARIKFQFGAERYSWDPYGGWGNGWDDIRAVAKLWIGELEATIERLRAGLVRAGLDLRIDRCAVLESENAALKARVAELEGLALEGAPIPDVAMMALWTRNYLGTRFSGGGATMTDGAFLNLLISRTTAFTSDPGGPPEDPEKVAHLVLVRGTEIERLRALAEQLDTAAAKDAAPRPRMSAERAQEIAGRCNLHVFWWSGAADGPPPSLAEYSLAELLEANHIVRDEGVRCRCDDRLVAALYAVYHYDPEDASHGRVSAIARAPGSALLCIRTEE